MIFYLYSANPLTVLGALQYYYKTIQLYNTTTKCSQMCTPRIDVHDFNESGSIFSENVIIEPVAKVASNARARFYACCHV